MQFNRLYKVIINEVHFKKVGDFLEFHGIHTDIDGDIESEVFTVGNSMQLTCKRTGEKEKRLMGESYNGKRSITKWSHSYTLKTKDEGCRIVFGKMYAESNASQKTSTGEKFTSLPSKGNETASSTEGISIGNVTP
ncbi:hypothetical protein D7C04_23645 [Salmonella enterica]|nr:hypothetical protein [Salmonella enterica]EBD7338772.1 hypothetical protein [Salmonella enterica]EDX0904535.1 hypothetical protein [Salmonella enterica subsp. enterica]